VQAGDLAFHAAPSFRPRPGTEPAEPAFQAGSPTCGVRSSSWMNRSTSRASTPRAIATAGAPGQLRTTASINSQLLTIALVVENAAFAKSSHLGMNPTAGAGYPAYYPCVDFWAPSIIRRTIDINLQVLWAVNHLLVLASDSHRFRTWPAMAKRSHLPSPLGTGSGIAPQKLQAWKAFADNFPDE
jgi:hypothetical protein